MTAPRWVHEQARRAVAPSIAPPAAAAAAGGMLPWAAAMASHWRATLGDHAETEAILGVVGSSLAPKTAANYGGHFSRFAGWCERQPDRPSPLPASTTSVLRWLAADVTAADRVRAGSLQPYLSALNRVHRDLAFDEPALGHMVQQFRRGLALRQADDGRASQRVYLPPDIVEHALEWALAQDRETVRVRASSRLLFRAAVGVVLTFVTFARGITGASMLVPHVRVSAAGVTVTLDREKGRRIAGVARTITFPPNAVEGLDALLEMWEDVRGEVASSQSYFAFPHERREQPSSQVDTWLRVILAHLGASPPAGESWTGHSLRKGAASGSSAVGAPLHVVCFMGGWSIKSRAVFDYIDPTCPASAAAHRFFGWLAPR